MSFPICYLSFVISGESRSSTVERQAYTLQAADYRVIRVRISAGLPGPEAHQDEFSTFNRGVVGSTPTRPMRKLRIANFELVYFNSKFEMRRKAREAQKAEYSIGNREVASSIPAAGSEVRIMAKILPIITQTKLERYAAWRRNALVRKMAVIRRRSRHGSIAQTAERRSHKSVAGGSIPPRAI